MNNKSIVIGMPLRNGAKTIKRAVGSVLNQKGMKRNIILFIANDNSTDNWGDVLKEYINDQRIIIKDVNFGKSYKVRNYINNYIRENIPNVDYIGRLDADDYITDGNTISKIEKIMDLYNPDIIISGNKLSLNDKIIDRVNKADKRLLNYDFLLSKLEQMSKGIAEGELPSCNTFIKPTVFVNHKEVESSEDHWFTVDLLLKKNKYKIHIAEDILYSVYSLSGSLTSQNRDKNTYLESRRKLLKYYLNKIKNE